MRDGMLMRWEAPLLDYRRNILGRRLEEVGIAFLCHQFCEEVWIGMHRCV